MKFKVRVHAAIGAAVSMLAAFAWHHRALFVGRNAPIRIMGGDLVHMRSNADHMSMLPPQKNSHTLQFFGINSAGAEFGMTNGQITDKYIWPEKDSIQKFRDLGMNLVRLPFAWERIQPGGYGSGLDNQYTQELQAAVKMITDIGHDVVLSPHNFARFHNELCSPQQLSDLWTRLANLFKGNAKVQFGLMNEPHDISIESWVEIATETVKAIRATGSKNRILVPGVNWTSAFKWTTDSIKINSIVDDNMLFEMHQYFDYDMSGTHGDCSITVPAAFTETTKWLRDNKRRGYLAEFGIADNDVCWTTLKAMLNFLNENSDVWVQATYWAAGPWWGDYFLSVEPPKNSGILNVISQQIRPQVGAVSSPLIQSSTSTSKNLQPQVVTETVDPLIQKSKDAVSSVGEKVHEAYNAAKQQLIPQQPQTQTSPQPSSPQKELSLANPILLNKEEAVRVLDRFALYYSDTSQRIRQLRDEL